LKGYTGNDLVTNIYESMKWLIDWLIMTQERKIIFL
jgi:hypothetical protein